MKRAFDWSPRAIEDGGMSERIVLHLIGHAIEASIARLQLLNYFCELSNPVAVNLPAKSLLIILIIFDLQILIFVLIIAAFI